MRFTIKILAVLIGIGVSGCEREPDSGKKKMKSDNGLVQGSERYIGQLLLVRPIYGWGWGESYMEGTKKKERSIDVPSPFHVRVERLWSFQDVRRGVVARVEEPNCSFNGYWVTLSTRHEGSYRFDEVNHYNITLDADEPKDGKDGWPLPSDLKTRTGLYGYAEVVAE